MEEAGIGVYNKVQKTWNISDLPRHLKTIPWRPHWTSVNQCALGMLFWRNTSLRNAVYIIIYLNKYFFIGFRNASIKCYVNRESQYLSTFIDASIVKWWNYFCVKKDDWAKMKVSYQGIILHPHRSVAHCSILSMLFWLLKVWKWARLWNMQPLARIFH